ncbi:hypothetical protein BGX21_003999, partial [Mortierella sp. AD011]
MILNYCLSVPGCQKTFSSVRWTILQVCPNLFEDVFQELFTTLYDNFFNRAIPESELTAVVREELLSVRSRLVALNFPNFSSASKLRLVLDEAQILSDGEDLFESSHSKSVLRPLLSPVLHGFRTPGKRNQLTVIYCGTGLSIRTLHWAQASGDGVKEPGTMDIPNYIAFPGWTDQASIQSFIDRLKDQLQDEESRDMVDALLPEAAVRTLHQRLRGRFRPVCTAIEGIIMARDPEKWADAIDDIETALTSYLKKELRGNLIGELNRVEAKIAQHSEQFVAVASIKETLELFIFRWFMLGETVMVLEDEARLVEAAFGRIKMLGGNARTVLDEPLALKAAINYFNHKDPLLIKAAQRATSSSHNPSVHGAMWEAMMPTVFVETFRDHPISSWPLPNNNIPEQLIGDVTIVGYNEQEPRLVINHGDISIQEFMEAHVQGNSKQGNDIIPPFYFPAPFSSGPDIIFFVQINEKKVPIFVQLKLRQVVTEKQADDALVTTSGHT